jgi:hypothetical protein
MCFQRGLSLYSGFVGDAEVTRFAPANFRIARHSRTTPSLQLFSNAARGLGYTF